VVLDDDGNSAAAAAATTQLALQSTQSSKQAWPQLGHGQPEPAMHGVRTSFIDDDDDDAEHSADTRIAWPRLQQQNARQTRGTTRRVLANRHSPVQSRRTRNNAVVPQRGRLHTHADQRQG